MKNRSQLRMKKSWRNI